MKKNRRPLIITVVLVVVSLYFLFFRDSFSTLGQKDNDFAVQDTGSVTKIFLADKANHTITLTRVKGGEWKVNDKYIARPDAINTLLYTMKMVAVKTVIDQNGVENVIKNLSSSGVKVEVYKGDDRIKLYYVGGPTADQLGTFMLLANPHSGDNFKQPYIMYIPGFDGYLTTRYFTKMDDWRNRSIMHYFPYALRSVAVTYPQSDSGFQVNIMGKNRFSVENPANHQPIAFDTIAVKQYLTYYQSVEWEVTVESNKRDSIIHSTPAAVINVKDTTGKVTDIKLFRKLATITQQEKYAREYKYDPDQMYALVNGQDFVIVQAFVFGKMLQYIGYFSHKRG
jgi:hypothetical protein